MSVLSLQRNGTSVAFNCSDDYDPSRQPRLMLQGSATYWVQAHCRVTVEGESSVNQLAGVFPSQITAVQVGGVTSSTDSTEV